MPNPPAYPGTGDDAGAASDRRPATRRPRRVYVLWTVGIVAVVVLFLVLHLTGVLGPESHQ